MKEATGELNMTVVVILAVSALIAFFYYTMWPMIKSSFEKTQRCSDAICDKEESSTKKGYVSCHKKDEEDIKFYCVYKG